MADPLYETKNYYYIGAFQLSVKEALKAVTKTPEEKTERDVFLYRCYVAQGKGSVVLSEVKDNAPEDSLKAVRLLARYESDEASRKKVADLAAELATSTYDELAQVVLSTILLRESRHDEVFYALNLSSLLEARALLVQNYLALNRKEVKGMQCGNEDATLTQLALSWLYFNVGREKLQEAFYLYQELIDKYGATANLLISQAATQILKGNLKQAEELLQQAEEKDSGSAALLINQYFINATLHKNEEVLKRTLTQLKLEHSNVQWVKDYLEHEKMLDEWEEA